MKAQNSKNSRAKLKKIHKWGLLLFFSCVSSFVMSGCGSFNMYEINEIKTISTAFSENYYKEKYYVNSIKGLFVTPQQEKEIKTQLPLKHPDFFVDSPTKGKPVDFYWTVDFNYSGASTAFLSGLTIGLIPCISWYSHTGKLTAKLKDEQCIYFSHDSFSGRTYPYLIKATEILHMMPPIIGLLNDGVWGAFLSSGKDTVSSFNAGIRESLSAPHNCCEANLRLFPKACNLMMGQVRARETKEKVQAMKSAQKKAAADSSKKIKPNTKNMFTLPVPPKMQEVGPKPRSVLLGKWNCQLLSKIKTVMKSINQEQITSTRLDITYTFMNDGKVIIEMVSKDPQPSKRKNLADFHYNGQTLTIKSKDTQGKMVVMQYKVIWYSDTKMELQILDTKEYEKSLLVEGIKKASYTIADNGISTTILYFETMQNGKKNTFHTELLSSPSIYNKTVK